MELKNFAKLCEQRRKFAVLYKLEFQVSLASRLIIIKKEADIGRVGSPGVKGFMPPEGL